MSCWLPAGTRPAGWPLALGAHHAAGPALLALAVSTAGRAAVSTAGRAAVPASPPLSTPALWLTGAERWLMLAGLSIALGGLAGRGLARQYLARDDTPAAPVRPPAPWALRGSLTGLVASAALLITALAAPGVAAALARPPAAGLGTRGTAIVAAAEAVCFALAAILARLRQPGWSVAPLLGVVLAEGIRAHPEGMIPAAGALLSYCHLLPAVLWAGMLVYTARAAIAWRAHPGSARGLFRLYGTAAAWLFGVVVVTGVISAILLVPLSSLLTTTYGRFLIVKAALVALAAALALVSRAGLRRPAHPGTRLPLATRLEIAALAAVLAATGLLTVLTPPARPLFSSGTPAAAGPVQPQPPAAGPSVLKGAIVHVLACSKAPSCTSPVSPHRRSQPSGRSAVRSQPSRSDIAAAQSTMACTCSEGWVARHRIDHG